MAETQRQEFGGHPKLHCSPCNFGLGYSVVSARVTDKPMMAVFGTRW